MKRTLVERACLGFALTVVLAIAVCICGATVAVAPAAGLGVSVSTLAGSAGAAGDADGAGAAARFGGPYALACNAAGVVYVADTDNGAVRKITPAGLVSTLVPSTAGLQYPQGIACDASGNVYVADTYDHVICKILPDGSLSTLAGLSGEQGTEDGRGADARFSYPAGLACDAAGDIYVADVGNGEVRKVTRDGLVTTLLGPDAGLDSPQSVACGPDGAVYVADSGGSRILRVAAGGYAVLAGPSEVSYPGGVACDAAGNVYVADTDGDCVRRCDGAGGAPVVAGSTGVPGSADGAGPDARFDGPQGLTCDADGNVLVADTGNDTVRRLSLDALAPVTKVSPALADDASSGWRKEGVTLTLTVSDAGSGVATTYYSVDGGASLPYSIPFLVSAPGSHKVSYYSVDAAGNAESSRSGYVNIDLLAPVTSSTPMSAGASSGWVATAQTVTLTATDDLSGVALTRFSVDGGPSTTYTAPFTIGAPGSHAVAYSSVDAAGNAESPHVAYVNIDDAPPVTTARPPLAKGPASGWRNTPLTVTLVADDGGSGVAGTQYSIDGGAAQPYSAPFIVSTPGSHVLSWSSVDVLGAAETTSTGYVNIDTSVPSSKATGAAVRRGASVTLHYRIEDAQPSCGSAVATLQVRRGSTTVLSAPLGSVPVNATQDYRLKVRLPKGAYTWRVQAVDIAGNRATTVSSARLTVR